MLNRLRYQTIHQIGEGSTSSVYLVKQLDSGEYRCVKMIKKANFAKETEIEFFRREVSILSKINHKNIVKFFDLEEDSNYYYMIMEYCEGTNLQKMIENSNKLKITTIKCITKQLISALMYLHSNNIGHRDIKPENMIIDEGSNLKLIDFGLSTDDCSNLCTTFCGSLAFAAPECINREPYFATKTDIWSAGVSVYYMATSSLPWKSSNMIILMSQITKGYLEFSDNMDSGLKDLISQMLSVDPNLRPSAEQLLGNSWLTDFSESCGRERRFTVPRSPRHQIRIPITRVKSIPSISITPPKEILPPLQTPRRQHSRKLKNRSASCDHVAHIPPNDTGGSILVSLYKKSHI